MMKIELRDPPRLFTVGAQGDITIKDMADIHLAPNEQVTFITEHGCRHDFACKDWGYYATPSVNGRLKKEGFKTAVVGNEQGLIYIMVVEVERLAQFGEYCRRERQTVRHWLDEWLVKEKT